MNIQDFHSGLLSLSSNFSAMEERDKSKRDKEFNVIFNTLISRVNRAKETGNWRKTHFNLFEVLGNQWHEDTHSNVLAWLLNPEEAHGIGDAFIRAFMEKVFNKENLPPFSNVEVTTRKKQDNGIHPDIVVESNNGCLVIENKIGSKENPNQTVKYANYFKDKGVLGEDVFLVYLNPNGDVPESPEFKPVSYKIIRELLEKIEFQGDSDILITHFIKNIFLNIGD